MQNNWILFFSAGVVAGGIVGYYICKKRYHIVKTEEVEVTGKITKDIDVEEAKEQVYKASYIQPEKDADEEWDEAEKVNPIEPEMVPYVISPESYVSEHNEFAKIVLLYYEENEVLEYEEYNEAEGDDHFADIGSTIGHDSLNHFGEFETDTLFVRNEELGNDYEVLLIHSAYDEGGDE